MPPMATNHALDVPSASQGGVVAAMHLLWATGTTQAVKNAILWSQAEATVLCASNRGNRRGVASGVGWVDIRTARPNFSDYS